MSSEAETSAAAPEEPAAEKEVAAMLAAAAAAPAVPRIHLTVSLGATRVKDSWFDKEVVTIGREAGCDVHIDNQSVSRRHAAIVRKDGVFALLDKKTENRSHVNGKEAGDFTLLNSGDEILVGKYTIKFENPTAPQFQVADVFGDKSESEMEKLGGATLAISKSQTNRLVKERGRRKGFVVLPTKLTTNKVFVAEAFVVGSTSDCDLRIKGWFAPRRAALVTRGMDDYRLYNVSPKPELVTVNGKPVSNFVVLSSNDVIRVGKHEFSFVFAD